MQDCHSVNLQLAKGIIAKGHDNQGTRRNLSVNIFIVVNIQSILNQLLFLSQALLKMEKVLMLVFIWFQLWVKVAGDRNFFGN